MYSSIPSAFLTTELLRLHDVKEVVISPGSRNAPLTIGFTENKAFNCHSIVDERSAAFYGLGLAKAKNEPVALVCTSGSALLNYFPAIAEAFYSDVPLLVLSADRPEYLLEIGDGQTILQEGVYGRMIAHSTSLLLDDSSNQDSINSINKSRIEASLIQLKSKQRPVHINIPFDEPLYNKTVEPLFSVDAERFEIEDHVEDSLFIEAVPTNRPLKVMCLVGTLKPSAEEIKWLTDLQSHHSVLFLHESLSQLNLLDTVDSIDTLIAPLEKLENSVDYFNRLLPDLLITAGGMIVSKKIKALLRSQQNLIHVHLKGAPARDTYFSLKGCLKINSLKALLNTVEIDSFYQKYWMNHYHGLEKRRSEYIENAPYSDFKAYSKIFKCIPEGYVIHMANSSAIRYAQLFPTANDQFCNRGTSGIEGSVSTAVGYAKGSDQPVILVTGDLSFLYDSNALWIRDLPSNFRIIVVNNSGGGIFRILPGKENSLHFSEYFETRHQFNAGHLAEHFDFDYISVRTLDDLEKALDSFFNHSSKPKLLEVITHPQNNEAILLNYFKALK
jgi:2-succinyl-5-enolpyruvyl-6-hydroxy-3-cyclohexene-1-carboxylate synthase